MSERQAAALFPEANTEKLKVFQTRGAGMNRLLHYVFKIDNDLPT